MHGGRTSHGWLMHLVAGAALGAAATGGFVIKAPAGPQPPPSLVKHYDPLP